MVSGTDEKKASEVLKNVYLDIGGIKEKNPDKFLYFAYMRAPLKKIMDEFRMQILLRLTTDSEGVIDEVYNVVNRHRAQSVTSYVEVNPIKLS